MLPAYPSRIVISDGAERYITQLLLDLENGDAELAQLPPSLFDFYVSAHDAGAATSAPRIAALQARVAYLEAECDRLYLYAHNTPAKVSEIYAQRLHVAATDYWEQWPTPTPVTETEAA